MARRKVPNPDSVSYEEFTKMDTKMKWGWVHFRLNEISEKLEEHDRRFLRLENRLWWVLGSVLLSVLLVVLTAALG